MIPLLLVLSVLLVYVIDYYRWVRKYPKGPTPLPLIGNLHKLDFKVIGESLQEISKEYGNVFTVFTPRPFVVIMDYDGIKEAFQTKGDDFVGRSGVFPNTLFQSADNGGVIFSQGDVWKENRRLSLHILRDFGMGKNLMEEQVKVSLLDMIHGLENSKDLDRIELRWPIQLFVGNVINKTLYDFIYTWNDCERLVDFAETISDVFESVRENRFVFLATAFPFIRRIPFLGWYVQGQYMEKTNTLRQHVREDVQECLKNYDPKDEPSCFAQAYLQRTLNNKEIEVHQMYDVCMDFFLAGAETTTTTLRWATNYMADCPEVQEKARAEVLSVCGAQRLPSLSDKPNLPYLNATILEVQRMANILPLNVIHRTVVDTSVEGVSVPGNTLVWGQIHNVLSASPVFENPKKFNPSRFLMEDGKTMNKNVVEQVVPFSIGKRQCAGEGLAKLELFLGLATMLQKFRFQPADGHLMDMRPRYGSIRFPQINYLKLTRVEE